MLYYSTTGEPVSVDISVLRRYCDSILSKYRKVTYLDADDLVQDVLLARFLNPNSKAKFVLWNSINGSLLTRKASHCFVDIKDWKECAKDYQIDSILDFLDFVNKQDCKDVRQALIRQYFDYKPCEIEDELGLKRHQATYLLNRKKDRLAKPKAENDVVKARREQVVKMAAAGMSQRQIAKHFGLSQGMIAKDLKVAKQCR